MRPKEKGTPGWFELPSKGTPLTMLKGHKAKKPFASIRSPHKRLKAREMESYRRVICGPDKNTDRQLSYEIKRLPLKKRKHVCELAGIKQGARITAQLGLALKSHSGMS